MSSLKHFLSGRGAAAAAASVSAAASTSSAQARVPVSPAPHHEIGHRDDEWLVTYHGHQGDVILFKPFQPHEVEDAFADVAKFVPSKRTCARDPLLPVSASPGQLQDEGHSGSSTPTSDGSNANSEIMRTCLTGLGMYNGGRLEPSRGAEPGVDMMTLLNLTNKMLKRPGMQVEIVKAMMEDAEIRNILLREGQDVDSYLIAAGAAPSASLLPPAVMACLEQGAAAPNDAERDGGNPFSNMIQAMLSALGHTGSGLGRLLNWMRSRFSFLMPRQAFQHDEPNGQGEAGVSGEARPGLPVFWQRVLTVATVIAVIVIFKRPMASFVRVGAASVAATAGAATWAGAAAASAGKREKEAADHDAAAEDANQAQPQA